MTRQNKLIALVVYLLILVIFMFTYRSNRSGKIKLLRADLAKISIEQDKARVAEAEAVRMTRLIPTDAGLVPFIETLYRTARESGLKQHEVTTEVNKSSGNARPGVSDANTNVVKQRLIVNASGNYRDFAEYVRRVQNIERFNRILDFRLSPDSGQLKGVLTIELYSLSVK